MTDQQTPDNAAPSGTPVPARSHRDRLGEAIREAWERLDDIDDVADELAARNEFRTRNTLFDIVVDLRELLANIKDANHGL